MANMYVYKVIVVGPNRSGKSSIVGDWYEGKMKTIGVEMTPKTFIVNGNNVKLQVWDTESKQPNGISFRNFVVPYFSGCLGVLFVFDITNKQSLIDLRSYIEDFIKISPNAIKFLVGAKTDLENERDVKQADIESLVNEFHLTYAECTAKGRPVSVDKVFTQLAQAIDTKRISSQQSTPDTSK